MFIIEKLWLDVFIEFLDAIGATYKSGQNPLYRIGFKGSMFFIYRAEFSDDYELTGPDKKAIEKLEQTWNQLLIDLNEDEDE